LILLYELSLKNSCRLDIYGMNSSTS